MSTNTKTAHKRRQLRAQQELMLTGISEALLALEDAGTIDAETFGMLASSAVAAGKYLDAAGNQLVSLEAGDASASEQPQPQHRKMAAHAPLLDPVLDGSREKFYAVTDVVTLFRGAGHDKAAPSESQVRRWLKGYLGADHEGAIVVRATALREILQTRKGPWASKAQEIAGMV